MLDWRNPADYEYTAGLTLHQWAWEFLRRNPEYRRRFFDLPDATPDTVDEQEREIFSLGRDFGIQAVFHPEADATQLFEIHWWIGAGVRLLWKHPNPGIGKFRHPQPPWPGFPTGLALLFDLREAIEPQLETTARYLAQHRERLPPGLPPPYKPTIKPHPVKYPTYIRVLDGLAADETRSEIGRHFFPKAKQPHVAIRHSINKAKELRDGGYRDLLYKPDT